MKKNKKVEYATKTLKNEGPWKNRLLIATPSAGNVRMEWVTARYGQVIPTNWSHAEILQWVNGFIPIQYLIPDAENLCAKVFVEGDYEWFLSIEDDNILPPDAFIRINEYMQKGDVPIVSGLYFTKSNPPEPIMYKGRGNGPFHDWKLGDKVWTDGIPFGFTLIHGSIIRAAWNESPEYVVNGEKTRRVFALEDSSSYNSLTGRFERFCGTTDLAWCTRIMRDKLFEKAGWPEYQKMEFPFLVDTNIVVGHIDKIGRVYPLGGIPARYKK